MDKYVCNNCRFWRYDRFTEDRYGMGVGICTADGSQQFCEHKCVLCYLIEGKDGE